MKITYYILLAASLLLCGCQSNESSLFEKLDSDRTGITFSNKIQNSDSLLLMSFEYIYNGGGVAIGDINNDGLQDIYFSGNLVSGGLYLNKGDFKFEDITTSAGIKTSKWLNGVSMVDINQDGYQDIYICAGGIKSASNDRVNLLYINNGNNTFTESAKAYGLADNGYSQHAAFFDYDLDGDLDMYLLSTELDPYNWKEYRPRRVNGEAPNNDKLYRNNGDDTFSDVSGEANILIEGYGLGIGICDINNDYWPDIYVANDFLSNDIIYINQQDGTFVDQADSYLDHTSRNGMGTDIQDINNDGLADIMVLDMLPPDNLRQKTMMGFLDYDKYKMGLRRGYQPQFPRNTLQLNNGNGTFSEIGQLAGIHQTDWSWSTLLQDFDNDGNTDVLITNGFRLDVTHMDFATYSRQITASGVGTEAAKREQMLNKLKELPEIKLHNYIYQNNGDLTFSDKSFEWGLGESSYSNGSAFADLNNDGALDLIINNIDAEAFIYRNNLTNEPARKKSFLKIKLQGNAPNLAGIGAQLRIKYGDQEQYRYFSPYRGYISTVENTLHFGLGETSIIDELEIVWPDKKVQRIKNIDVAENSTMTLSQRNATELVREKDDDRKIVQFVDLGDSLNIDYVHKDLDFSDFKVQPILPHKFSDLGPGIAVGDVNGDSLEDFYVGGSPVSPGSTFIQKTDGTFEKGEILTGDQLKDMGSLLFDADNDGDNDLYIVGGGSEFRPDTKLYQDKLYLNDGSGQFTLADEALPEMFSSGSSVSATDYDKDGDLDLFVGGRILPGSYPMPASSYLLRNDSDQGKCIFTDVTEQMMPGGQRQGLVTSAIWSDYDGDSWPDLIVVGEWMPVTLWKNVSGKSFRNETNQVGLSDTQGWWNSISAGDFDNDGDTDYLVGNQGLNTHFKASKEEPVCIYAKDYDKNGRIDPVMCYYNNGENYLAHSRDDLIEQISAMRVRFKTYDYYGKTPFSKSFRADELKDAYVVKSKTFSSSYLENQGDGKFKLKPLPRMAQVSPVFGIQVDDYNNDGNLDALLVGNSYGTHVAYGPYDAGKGIYLQGNGNGDFEVKSNGTNGFLMEGNAKALTKIRLSQHETAYIGSRNDGPLSAFMNFDKTSKSIQVKKDDVYAVISFKNGSSRREEFYYGSSYLSQASRVIEIEDTVEKVEIFNRQDVGRIIKLNL